MFRSFFTTIFRGPPLCFVPLLFLPLICARWVCIITQYVAACVCHPSVCVWCSCLLVICLWTVFTSRSPTDSSMWPQVYVICVCLVFLSVGDLLVNLNNVIISSFNFDSIMFCTYCHILLWCFAHFRCMLYSCWLRSRSPTDKNTKHTQMTYTCGHILRNNTNSTNANQREEQ